MSLPVLAGNEPFENPTSTPRRSADGPQPSSAEETRDCKVDAVSETDIFESSTGNFNISALDHLESLLPCRP